MHQHTEVLALDLARRAQHLRIDVLDMVMRAKSGHIGGPFSAAEIVAALYFHHLRVDPADLEHLGLSTPAIVDAAHRAIDLKLR